MILVLSLGSFSRFVTVTGDGMVSLLFLAGFPQTGLKVLRMRLKFSEIL
ncbi:MAG TPA: hypothetical protein VGW39_07310 [Chthoniobacterales bacterium]|nr:hypothetical protein [Chthoniobacterales bacterium]